MRAIGEGRHYGPRLMEGTAALTMPASDFSQGNGGYQVKSAQHQRCTTMMVP